MSKQFPRLVAVMEKLRGKDGCPWDREQTRESLKPFLLEEAYEVLEAMDDEDPEILKEELGDLMFQVLFHAQIARERGAFSIEDVLRHAADKMIRRHPHVFGPAGSSREGGKPAGAKEVLARWEELKHQENRNAGRKSILDGVPRSLPALLRAQQLQARAARVGFDWSDIKPVWAKVREEWRELEASCREDNRRRIEHEMGDLLFALVNLARALGLNAEEALRKADHRFSARFGHIERGAKTQGRPLQSLTPSEMDALWEEAKGMENPGRKTVRRSKKVAFNRNKGYDDGR